MASIVAAGLAAGAMSAAGSVLSSSLNKESVDDTNRSNRMQARETNEANRKLAEQQNQWNLEQWQRETAYNKPSEQVKRLQEAGLSQAAAAQAIDGAGNASNIQSANLATDQIGNPIIPATVDFNAIPSMLGAMRDAIGIKEADAKASMAATEAGLRNDMLLTDIDAKNADIQLKRQQYVQLAKSFPYTLRSLRYQSKADRLLPAQREADLQMSKVNRELVEQNVKLARQKFDFLNKMNPKELERMQHEIHNVVEQFNLYKSQERLNKSQANLNDVTAQAQGEQVQNLQHLRRGIDLDNAIKDCQRILQENGCPESVASRIGVMIANGKIPLDKLNQSLRGTKDYLHYGHSWLGGDAYTQDFLYNVLDEGRSTANKYNIHQVGAVRDAMLGTQLGQWLKLP